MPGKRDDDCDEELQAFAEQAQASVGQFLTRQLVTVRELLAADRLAAALEEVRIIGATLELLGVDELLGHVGGLMSAVQQGQEAQCLQILAELQAAGSVEVPIRNWGSEGPSLDAWRRAIALAASEPTLDENQAHTLMALQSSDPTFLATAARMFGEASERHVKTMHEALGQNDAELFVDGVQQLSGLCTSVGAARLRALCRTIDAGNGARLCSACAVTSILLVLRLARERHAVLSALQDLSEGRGQMEVSWRDRLCSAVAGPLIDDAVLDQIVALKATEGFMERVLEVFDRTGRERLQNLASLAAGGEMQDVAGVAHSLKGAAANVGGQRLAALCRELQTCAETGMVDACGAFLDPMWDAFRDTSAYLMKIARN